MREIKFRAWLNGEYYYDITKHHIEHNYMTGTGGDVFDFSDWIKYSIVEQFTGIHDATGKEIYEGDILDCDSWWWGPCAIKYTTGDVGPCVGDNVMQWRLYRDGRDVHNLWNGKDVKIIGNIHKNPELMEEPHV